jgi:hypothetical protein
MKAGKTIPELPRKLKGNFWGIATFFNPCRYAIRLTNYKKFREANRKRGLKLICVELAFGASPYELLDDDAEIMVRRRTTSVLWQKERLLNCALKYLPEDCDKVAWLDADLLFLNDYWIKEMSDLLNSYAVVQPFAFVRYLPKEAPLMDVNDRLNPIKGMSLIALVTESLTTGPMHFKAFP